MFIWLAIYGVHLHFIMRSLWPNISECHLCNVHRLLFGRRREFHLRLLRSTQKHNCFRAPVHSIGVFFSSFLALAPTSAMLAVHFYYFLINYSLLVSLFISQNIITAHRRRMRANITTRGGLGGRKRTHSS